MPKIDEPSRRDLEVETALAAFEEPTAWKRSKKGNLWRKWDDVTLTIFKRPGKCFGWCIVDGDDQQYSPDKFESEEDAMSALGYELGIGL